MSFFHAARMPETILFMFSCVEKGGTQFQLMQLSHFQKTEMLEIFEKLFHVSSQGPA